MEKKERLWNVPNMLSAYRILVFPVILWLIVNGERDLFFIMLCVNLVTDIADGLIARTFKLETEFGAKLDSWADVGTYILAFTGMMVIEHVFVWEHRFFFGSVIGLWVMQQIISFVRFGKSPHLHLYSSKVTGYIQGIFMLSYFTYGYVAWYFYFMAAFSCAAYLEEIIILLRIPVLRSNVKGIYFILKEHKRII